jgi:hypothetical protein
LHVFVHSPPSETGRNQILGSIGLRSQRTSRMGFTSADVPKAQRVHALARSVSERPWARAFGGRSPGIAGPAAAAGIDGTSRVIIKATDKRTRTGLRGNRKALMDLSFAQ